MSEARANSTPRLDLPRSGEGEVDEVDVGWYLADVPGRQKGTRGADRYRTEPALAFKERLERMAVDEMILARHILTRAPVEGPGLAAFLRELADHLDRIPSDAFDCETRLGRGLVAHYLAAVADFADDYQRGVTCGDNLFLLGLDEADLNCRAVTGQPLRGPTDYRRFKPKWGPALSSIYARFGKRFSYAVKVCGLDSSAQPEAILLRTDGRPRDDWSLTRMEREELLALGLERNYGRRLTYEGWNGIRQFIAPGRIPSAHQLIGHRTKQRSEFKWDEMTDKAYAYALRHPERFPYTAAYKTDVDRLRRGVTSLRKRPRRRQDASTGVTPLENSENRTGALPRP